MLALVGACATELEAPHPKLTRVWRDYQELPARRALAIAGDPRGNRWVTGASGGHASDQEARAAALAACQERRMARRLRAACVLYALGDELVWSGP